jgi:hypothetical protein
LAELKNILKIAKNLLKPPGSSLQNEKMFYKFLKPSSTSWVFFAKLKNMLNVAEKPP